MTERTEEEILTQAGIEVVLGGKLYSIKPLVIRDARVWRKETLELVAPLSAIAGTTSATPDAFGDALKSLLVSMPDKVIDLFFLYAKDLDRDEIEGEATEAEITKAFSEVVAVAFPLAESAPEVLTRITKGPRKGKKSR